MKTSDSMSQAFLFSFLEGLPDSQDKCNNNTSFFPRLNLDCVNKPGSLTFQGILFISSSYLSLHPGMALNLQINEVVHNFSIGKNVSFHSLFLTSTSGTVPLASLCLQGR